MRPDHAEADGDLAEPDADDLVPDHQGFAHGGRADVEPLLQSGGDITPVRDLGVSEFMPGNVANRCQSPRPITSCRGCRRRTTSLTVAMNLNAPTPIGIPQAERQPVTDSRRGIVVAARSPVSPVADQIGLPDEAPNLLPFVARAAGSCSSDPDGFGSCVAVLAVVRDRRRCQPGVLAGIRLGLEPWDGRRFVPGRSRIRRRSCRRVRRWCQEPGEDHGRVRRSRPGSPAAVRRPASRRRR